MLYTVAETSHAGYLIENLKPPDLSEPGLGCYMNMVGVRVLGKLHGEEK